MWCYKSGGKNSAINGSHYDSKAIDRLFAHQIRLIGLQNGPVEGGGVKRHLRDALSDSKLHFQEIYPDAKHMGLEVLSVLVSRYLITDSVLPILSRNFQACCDDLGQVLAGDEKLLHFTGNLMDVRAIKSKPDRMGLWFYQLMATLSNDTQFLLHTKLWESDPSLKISVPSFSACDKFNRNLHNCRWPFRFGGGGRMGDLGHHHKFSLACILQNTFNARNCLHKIEYSGANFREQCLSLADALYE